MSNQRRFLKNTRVSRKILLIVTVMAIPLSIALYAFGTKMSEDITFRRKEFVGVQYLRVLRPMLDHIEAHREVAAAAQYDPAMTPKLEEAEKQFEADLAALRARDTEYYSQLPISDSLNRLRATWYSLRTGKAEQTAAYNAHDDVAGQVVAMMRQIGDTSNLNVDPDVDILYLISLTVSDIPETVKDLSAFKARVTDLTRFKEISPETRAQLLQMLGTYQGATRTIGRDMALAREHNKAFAGLVENATDRSTNADQALQSFIATHITNSKAVAFDAQQVREVFDRTVNGRWTEFDFCLTELEKLLNQRIAGLEQQAYKTAAMLLPAILLMFLTCYAISRSITGPLQSAVTVSKTIARGDLSAAIPPQTKDEVGQLFGAMLEMSAYLHKMAGIADELAGGNLRVSVQPKGESDRFGTSFKNMLDNTISLVQSRVERDQIQDDITKLLDEVAGVGAGDLTGEAAVTAGPTGAIADSFNFMVEELRKIVRNVKGSTEQVKVSADTIQSVTLNLAKGSVDQARQIAETAEAVKLMADSIQQVSENAKLSAAVADQSRSNALQGTRAVENSMKGMLKIREQVQETSKRIKRLGERSQEIGEIIKLIDDIADRTSLLALNASIQAAMAGDAGRGFAVVAEEVERLADRSIKATKQIASLVKSIQGETNDAVSAMEETTREVVEGSSLANEAGQALAEIEGVSNRLADLIKTISTATLEQARGSEDVAQAMASIMKISKEIESGSNNAAQSVGTLVAMADSLQGSVSTFQLPGETVH